MKSKKVYRNSTKQLKIDLGIHKLLSDAANKQQTTIKSLVEASVIDYLKNETIQN